jgi:ubiquitin C-terminal hydrolase
VEGEADAVPNINTTSKITSFFSQTASLKLTKEQQEARDRLFGNRSADGASTPPFAKRSSTDDVGNRTPPPSSRTRSVTSSGVRRRLSPSNTTTMATPRRLNFQSSSAELALGPNRSTQKTPVKNPYQKLKSKPEERPHGGLQNLGNTCYLNATLQLLFSISGFLQDLKDVHDTLKKGNPKLPLTGALLEVAWNFGLVNGSPKPNGTNVVDPSRVKHAMDALTDKFSGYEQRDAHEFASGLIDLLHEELLAATESSSKKGDIVSEETSQGEKEVTAEKKLLSRLRLPTDTYFRLDVKVCLTCDHCKYTRCKEEMYRHLSIDVGADEEESWSVEKGLKQFFRPEVREIKCEKCDLGMTATQTTHIIKSPEVLLLHLKRFIITQMTPRDDESAPRICVRKNKARVTCKDFISIEDFHEVKMSESVSADDNKCNPYQYVLNGVVRHFGGSAVSGHYTADSLRIKPGTSQEQQNEGQVINRSTKEWVSFDDSISSYSSWKSMSSERNERSSYLFLFSLHD